MSASLSVWVGFTCRRKEMSVQKTRTDSIPDEVLGFVLSFLSLEHIHSCSLTCTRWSTLCWKYQRRLDLNKYKGTCTDTVLEWLRANSPELEVTWQVFHFLTPAVVVPQQLLEVHSEVCQFCIHFSAPRIFGPVSLWECKWRIFASVGAEICVSQATQVGLLLRHLWHRLFVTSFSSTHWAFNVWSFSCLWTDKYRKGATFCSNAFLSSSISAFTSLTSLDIAGARPIPAFFQVREGSGRKDRSSEGEKDLRGEGLKGQGAIDWTWMRNIRLNKH